MESAETSHREAERVLRRKKLPDAIAGSLEAFRAVVAEVETAKDVMTSTVPSTRSPGTPLAQAIAEFEEHLGRAQELMPSWRHPEIEDEWLACEAGIEERRQPVIEHAFGCRGAQPREHALADLPRTVVGTESLGRSLRQRRPHAGDHH